MREFNPIRLAEEIIDHVFESLKEADQGAVDRNLVSTQLERGMRNDIADMIDERLKAIEGGE